MYQALYRKWRPRGFDDVAGQEHVTQTLRRQITGGRLSHAYLFVGTRGTGKTTCAKILSRAVNCENPDNGNPCNTCPTCKGIENGSILDVLELDAASNNGVDNVRALRDEAVYSPASAKRRVYIIDEVHMLTASAFNALLKILEEPPEHLLFILATTELHKVPATILSRCQRFTFKRLTPETIAARLAKVAENEGLILRPDAAVKLSRLADGSMRDALSLLDQCAADTEIGLERVLDTLGLAGNDELHRLVKSILGGETESALSVLDKLFGGGKDISALLNEMAALLRDALVFSLSNDSPLLSGGFTNTQLSAFSDVPAERLFYCLDVIRDTQSGLTRGGSTKLAAEMCIFKMSDERLSESSFALLSRVARLEELYNGKGSPGIRKNEAPVSKPKKSSNSVLSPAETPPWEETPSQREEFPEQQKDSPSQEGDSPQREDTPPWEKASGFEVAHGENKPEGIVQVQQDAQADNRNKTQTKTQNVPGNETQKETGKKTATQSDTDGSSGGVWRATLDLLKNDKPVYTLLGNASQVSAELQGAILTVRAGNAFTASAIESKTVMEPLRAAAEKALGRAITVRLEQGGVKQEDTRGKLERLSAFDIIKFE